MNDPSSAVARAIFKAAVSWSIAGLITVASGDSALAVISPNSGFFDFNNLSPGALVGQDGWTGDVGVGSPLLGVLPGVNNTLAATGSSGSTNSGVKQFAMHAGGGPGGSLGAGGINGRYLTLTMDGKSWPPANLAVVGVGSGAGGSIFGDFSFAFFFGLNQGAVAMYREQTGSITATALSDIKPTYNNDDWYSVQMQVDLAANGGNGSGSLLIRDLTDGEASFIAVPGAQNINLQLLTSTAPNPLQWTRLAIWHHSGYGGSGAVDNVGFQAVPEPGAGVLFVLGLVSLLTMIRKRKSR